LDFGGILARLGINRGTILYVQSSMDRLRAHGFSAGTVLNALHEAVGEEGTLVMPGYAFVGDYEPYLVDPTPFDVRRTAVATGLLPALLFRRSGTVRSANPFYPVLASGTEATQLIVDHDSSTNPLDDRSPYRRMIDRDVRLFGAGVSLNYNSFIHTIDLQYVDELPFTYLSRPRRKDMIDHDGRRQTLTGRLPVAEVIRRIRPAEAYRELPLADDDFAFIELQGTFFFSLRVQAFEKLARAHANARLRAGSVPCWLEAIRITTHRRRPQVFDSDVP
jgi:aminoglycoside N3'-acetyltransferase